MTSDVFRFRIYAKLKFRSALCDRYQIIFASIVDAICLNGSYIRKEYIIQYTLFAVWGNWDECTETCDLGTQYRSKIRIRDGRVIGGGKTNCNIIGCVGEYTDYVHCDMTFTS